MNKDELQAKQQEQQEQRIKTLTLKTGAAMINTVLPTMQGGNWDNYSLPEKTIDELKAELVPDPTIFDDFLNKQNI